MPSPFNPDGFLKPITDYKQLLFYKKTVILYDMTFFFVNRYLERGDRTIDQILTEGGIKEQMSAARRRVRGY